MTGMFGGYIDESLQYTAGEHRHHRSGVDFGYWKGTSTMLAKLEGLWGRDYLTSSLCLSSFSSLNLVIFISLRAAASLPRVRENEEGFAVYRS